MTEDVFAAVALSLFGVVVVSGATAMTVEMVRDQRKRRVADGVHAPVLARTRAWQATRDVQGRRVNDSTGRHRRIPGALQPAVRAVGVAAMVRNPVAEVDHIFEQVMAPPLPSPVDVDVLALDRELREWQADPDRTGLIVAVNPGQPADA